MNPYAHKGYVERDGQLHKVKLGEAACETVSGVGELGERKLHERIIEFCDKQWPRWKYIRARMDVPSTLPVGCHDLTVFAKFPNCFLIEAKVADGKLSKDQQIWKKEMDMIGWTVHVVRDFETFLKLVK